MDFDAFVLAAATADLADEPAARVHADAVEFRMDLADDPLAVLDGYTGELPVIATNRVVDEGGDAQDTPDRLDALCAAAEHSAVGAVDVELSAIEAGPGAGVVPHAREHDAAIVASFHDFEATPPADHLRDRLERAVDVADVGKVAVTARDAGDVLDVLAVTWDLAEAGHRVATMAMGAPGRHSRVVAPLYGSRIGYAPIDPARTTAPGQYDLETMRSLIDSMRPEG